MNLLIGIIPCLTLSLSSIIATLYDDSVLLLMKSGKLIHDLPEGEKPREKMLRLGPSSLGDDELLAIFLRTGVPGENAIAIGRRLLDNHAGLPGLARTDIPILSKEHGLGPAKACQLAAAFELGVRLARRNLDRAQLENPQQIYEFMAPQMRSLKTESLRVLALDSRLCCQQVYEVTHGTSNQTLAMIRDVLRPVILSQAPSFAVVHNHPSGDPTPSRGDLLFTKELQQAAELFQLQLADHVIIGHPRSDGEPYYSFAENKRLA